MILLTFMLLFTHASRTDLQLLTNIRNLAARLLSAGMLLTWSTS